MLLTRKAHAGPLFGRANPGHSLNELATVQAVPNKVYYFCLKGQQAGRPEKIASVGWLLAGKHYFFLTFFVLFWSSKKVQ